MSSNSIVTTNFTPGPRLIDGTQLNSAFAAVSGVAARALPGIYSGNWYFVNESIGSDAVGQGTVLSPYATLSHALSKCTANQNDVVCFSGTIHLTASLAWNKNGVHLIGACAPMKRGKRARISVTGSTGFNKLLDITASGCNFVNFGTFYGWTDSSTSLLAISDTGGRNSYDNVEFLGFGDGTASTGSANLTGSRAFYFSTSTGESTFRNCVFGVDTTTRNVTNYTVEIAGNAPRMSFHDCDFEAYLGASGGSSSHILIGSAGIDRYCEFVRCNFLNATNSSATAMTQCVNVSSSAGGTVLLRDCTGYGFTHWQTTPSTAVVINMVAPTAHDGGIAIESATS